VFVMIGTVAVLGGEHTQAARLQVPVYLVDGEHEALAVSSRRG
jgi:hypothetical protein